MNEYTSCGCVKLLTFMSQVCGIFGLIFIYMNINVSNKLKRQTGGAVVSACDSNSIDQRLSLFP